MPEENKKEEGIRRDAEKKEMHPEYIAGIEHKAAPIDLGITRVLGAGGGGGQRGFRFTVGRKLMWSFLALSLIPILIISILSYRNSSTALKKEAFAKLTAVAKIKHTQIAAYFSEKFGDLDVLSGLPLIVTSLQEMEAAHDASGMNIGAFVKTSKYEAINRKIDPFLRKYKDTYGYHDLFLMDDEGDIIYTVEHEPDFGTNVLKGRYRNSNLARLMQRVYEREEAGMMDYEPYAPSNNEPAAFIGQIIYDNEGKKHGAVAIQLSIDQIDAIMQEKAGMGETGETYLVGEDFLMRSDSRFEADIILKRKVDTEATREVFAGRSGQKVIKDYRDVSVLSIYAPLKIKDITWGIISEIDAAEAFAPIKTLRNWILLITLLTIVIVVVAARMIAMGIVNPLQNTVGKIKEIAEAAGDLTKNVEVKSNDEIGDLGNAFNSMIFTLGALVRRVRIAAMHIVSASTQILSASQQHATGAAQQSSQITEVTGALNELVAAAKQVSLSADEVARISDGAVKTAESGSKAVEDTISANTRINDSVKEMAKKVETLGRKSKKITGILDLLDDITEQTNLLAINAAIEAAKAGEVGKGFTVVADEIRKLADSSRKATKDISVLIEEIQEDTQETVAGMKESTSLVDEGTSRATNSGEAIKMISFSIEKSAQSVRQIALAAQQQTTGAAQVSKTMADVNAVVKQGAAGTEQSLRSAKDLAAMAEQLKASMAQFRIRENGNRDN